MTCEHLIELEQALIAEGFEETFRGRAWSENVREWVYFRVCLDLPALRAQFNLDPCVQDHSHLGTHDGSEAGVQCSIHHDGIMGRHPSDCARVPTYP